MKDALAESQQHRDFLRLVCSHLLATDGITLAELQPSLEREGLNSQRVRPVRPFQALNELQKAGTITSTAC